MPPDARLLALAGAVPPHSLRQETVCEAAGEAFAGPDSPWPRLRAVYANAGVETRQAALPLAELSLPRGWRERHGLFRTAALDLLESAARDALTGAGLEPPAVDVLLVATSSGLSVPSLDALLLDRLGLRRDVERLPLVGYGCAGGVLGLARAAAMARARPGAVVLFLTVELCTLTFRPGDRSRTNLVATALFGDGAAAAVVRAGRGEAAPRLTAWGEHCWPDSEWVMGWRIEDDGLGVDLAPGLPELLRREAPALLDGFLAGCGLQRGEIDHWAPHPGGAKVLAALAEGLALPEQQLRAAREVLRRHGNMSAPTALFVLDEVLKSGATGRLLSLAFGPGFTAAFLLLETEVPWPIPR